MYVYLHSLGLTRANETSSIFIRHRTMSNMQQEGPYAEH